ncbi:MAG: LytR family transcriptional regulator, partial [Fervidobacterium sp.]
YRYYIINNSNARNEKIGKYLEEKFNKVDFKPSNIFYEGVDAEFKKNTVLLLRKNEDIRNYAINVVKSTFPDKEFEIIFVDDRIDFVSKYLSIIDELTKKGKKIRFPIDFIIVLKEI